MLLVIMVIVQYKGSIKILFNLSPPTILHIFNVQHMNLVKNVSEHFFAVQILRIFLNMTNSQQRE